MEIMQRKNEVTKFIENSDVRNRLSAYFSNDSKKFESFKSNVIKLSLNPSLAKCSVKSIFQSALNLAELDLDLNPMMGLAYVVSYGKEAQSSIGYKGYLKLAERAGKLVKANHIFKCDSFMLTSDGFSDKVSFIPDFENRDEDNKDWYNENFKGVLVRIKDIKTGEESAHFVSAKKIYKISGMSPAKNSNFSPYANWFSEMHLAKALKYILSKVVISTDILRAAELDNKIDIIESQKYLKTSDVDIDSLLSENTNEISFNKETGEVE